ncbi:MAG: Cof-type HAD-IIB family hydrolase [Spirulinaceae cyanobacterium]
MSDIRLLVLDVDGTIAGPSNVVSPAVVQALQQVQARGIKVAIATGRMYCSALRFHEAIGSTEPLTAYNGAWIQQPGMIEPLLHCPLPTERVAEIIDFVEQSETWRSRVEVHLYAEDMLFLSQQTPQSAAYLDRSGVPANVLDDLRSLLDRQFTKVLLSSPDPEVITELMALFRGRYRPQELHITQSTETYLEFTQSNINKGTAIAHLAQHHYGLPLSQVMAIGDNFNDLEMIQQAGIGVAMGNAPAGVKAEADWVTRSVAEDGVALAVEQFLLV